MTVKEYLNARVGDSGGNGVVGAYEIPGVNENGECVVEMCEERGNDGIYRI